MALQVLPRIVAAASTVKDADAEARYAPAPWEEILPGENIVNPTGTLPEELKQLYVSWKLAEAEVEHAAANLRGRAIVERKEFTDPSYASYHTEMQCLGGISAALAGILNSELRALYPHIAHKPQVHVRKGWIVIWRAPPQAGPVPNVAPQPPGRPN